jgi:hypothetical protein
MIGALLSVAALVATFAAGRRRLASGIGVLATAGYGYGILRAHVFDGAAHFVFDAAVVGLYAAAFTGRVPAGARGRDASAVFWAKALFLVPLLMFLVPLQHPLVQLVGLRGAVLFVPMIVVGARLDLDELSHLSRWLAWLNLAAFAVALGELAFGVETFFPRNLLTETIFRSDDAGAARALRIPATFLSAHAYGGTMIATLPFVAALSIDHRARGLDRMVGAAAVLATVLGVFVSATRQHALVLIGMGAAFLLTRAPVRVKIAGVAVAVAVGALVASSDRFQRFAGAADAGTVRARIEGSTAGFLDVALSYPLGAGLARGSGTSIPYFLASRAKPQIGLENEFSRLVVDQGLFGLALWIAFASWTVARRPVPPAGAWATPLRVLRLFVLLSWGSAFIGTGLLLAIPQAAFLLLGMGVLAVARPRGGRAPSWRRPLLPPARVETSA